MGTTAPVFLAEAQGADTLTASDLVNRPLSEWDQAIQGARPGDMETFAHNLRNTFEQEFDRLLSDRSIHNIARQFDRVREGALYPNEPDSFTDIPAIQDALRESYDQAIGPKQENGRYVEDGAGGDQSYGKDELRQDLTGARDEIMSTIDRTIERIQNMEAAPAAEASQAIEARNQTVNPATTLSI